jgi:hypothetical protein
MYVPDAESVGATSPFPNLARRRRFVRIVVPILIALALIVCFSTVVDWTTHGAASAVRFAVGLVVVESAAVALASILIIGRAPRQVWRAEDAIRFRAYRMAGGFVRPSVIQMPISDLRDVRSMGEDAVILGTARIRNPKTDTVRSYSEWIVVDRRLVGELGIGNDRSRSPVLPSEKPIVTDVHNLGNRERTVGFAMMMLGSLAVIITLVVAAVSGESKTNPVPVYWALGLFVVVAMLGLTVSVIGMFRRARGTIDQR